MKQNGEVGPGKVAPGSQDGRGYSKKGTTEGLIETQPEQKPQLTLATGGQATLPSLRNPKVADRGCYEQGDKQD